MTAAMSTHPAQPLAPAAAQRRYVVAQLGARRDYAVPRLLEAAGMLERFYTDLAANSGWPAVLARIMPRGAGSAVRRFLGRAISDVPPKKIATFPLFGFERALRSRGSRRPEDVRRRHLAANRRFGRLVAAAGFGEANALYVFNGAALEILVAARAAGLFTVLDQTSSPVAFEEAMLAEEHRRFPEWGGAIIPESVWRPIAQREQEEWKLADLVLCGSDHVRDRVLETGFTGQTAVVPYGIHIAQFPPRPSEKHGGPLRLLYVGNIRLLKGVQYLPLVAQRLGRAVEMRLVGPVNLEGPALEEMRRHVQVLGPVPRDEVQRHYQWADAFIFPSLSEGSAAVCFEALASGMPVITTPNAGSVVRDGVDGFIVPARDVEAMTAAVQKLLDDPRLVREMSISARQQAEAFDVQLCGKRLTGSLAAHPEDHS